MTKLKQFSALVAAMILTGAGASASLIKLSEDTHLHLLADASVVYQSNVFLLNTDFIPRISDTYLLFSPGVELRIAQHGSASAVLRYQHSFKMYKHYSELDGDYSDLSLTARYNPGRIMTSGYARYRQESSADADGAIIGVRGRLIDRDHTDYGASLRYEITQLTSVGTGVSYSKTDYDNDELYTDHSSISVPVTLYYRVRPKIDLTAGLRYRDVDTSDSTGQNPDYRDTYYFVGAVGELFTPVLYADVSVGVQERTYRGLQQDRSSATYNISFIYTGDVKRTYYATLARDYRTSAIGGTTYTFSSGAIGARYQMTNQIGFNAGLTYGESRYQFSPRAEDMWIFQLGATYNPNEYVSLAVRYEYTDVEGKTLGSATYQNSQVRVSASLRY